MQSVSRFKRKTLEALDYVIVMAPALILFVVLCLTPFFQQIWYSFTNWNGIKADYDVLGVANYVKVFSDTKFNSPSSTAFLRIHLPMFFTSPDSAKSELPSRICDCAISHCLFE